MAKKELLFVINNLHVGGAEKALLSLLQNFDYTKYNVDLQLFKQEGLFLDQLPSEVRLLPVPENIKYFDMPFSQVIEANLAPWKWNVIYRRIQFKIRSRKANSIAEAAQLGWKPISKSLKKLDKTYDTAIGFLQNGPNYFVIDKVVAKKKIGYIHNDYIQLKLNKIYDDFYFNKLDFVVSVSEKCVEILKQIFPRFIEKFVLLENISSAEVIYELSKEKSEFTFKTNNILSIGRLSSQKNFELAIETAAILKDKSCDFEWNIIGEGEERERLELLIGTKNLQSVVKLLGLKENPYPYILNTLIYVQTSSFEGKSIAIDEAKILAKPILVTNFPTAKDQIENGVNGLIAEMDAKSLANIIERLLNNEKLRNELSANLRKENLGNGDELQKFYQLIER